MTTLLELKNVSKQYGPDTKALSDVNFSVNEGEFISVIGPSGAGKSTLLRCINRMIDATDGEIIFDGVTIQSLKKKELRKLRTKIGMIFQHYNLVNRLSVIENVLHGRLGYKSTFAGVLGLYNQSEKKQAIEMLHRLGLEDQVYKRCDQLSGGQKQRVGIARALVQNPKMLLCDEPIASLDPNASKVIMDYLKDISTTMGITVLVNLHQVDVALNYSDRIIGVSKGSIVYNGSPTNITTEEIHHIYGSEAGDLIVDVGGRNAG
ncbi:MULTISPECIES: phosphonate ABC transporter ATP-binding protein [Bacillaceae]|uniref:phosphonate ABC transporter ATP-binding protein n=1 Tax=Bacillaceae TaxID=186817 RepID=UPI000478680D|nr:MULTISPECIES: phosphonate ABC transporter ATP-binding protein [Bacillaceae]UOE94891.1 phosphonate ABC transporter ATP-binding protein [Alkalihalobacillus sp. LMS39]